MPHKNEAQKYEALIYSMHFDQKQVSKYVSVTARVLLYWSPPFGFEIEVQNPSHEELIELNPGLSFFLKLDDVYLTVF